MSEITDRITDAASIPLLNAARAVCPSRTLREALRVEATPEGFVLAVPHYWAPYYHGGRGVINARPGKKLVFYKNPDDDPRISGGYPVRLSDVRRLTSREFYRDLRAGRLIATKQVGPAPAHEFLGDSLTVRAVQVVDRLGAREAEEAVRRALGVNFNTTVTTQF